LGILCTNFGQLHFGDLNGDCVRPKLSQVKKYIIPAELVLTDDELDAILDELDM